MLPVRYSPKAEKYFRKLKDKELLKKFHQAIQQIRQNPAIGDTKTGDLAGFFGYDIYHNKTNYELAYTIENVGGHYILVIIAGTRENFYEELKRYIRS